MRRTVLDRKRKRRKSSHSRQLRSEEAAVEELTGKEVMPEEAITVVDVPAENAAPEEVPVMNAPPSLEELAWVTLQEVRKLRESAERCEHFEFGIWDELRKLVTLKAREVALVQGNVAPTGVAQERAMVGKIRVPGKGKKRAREPEEEEETLV